MIVPLRGRVSVSDLDLIDIFLPRVPNPEDSFPFKYMYELDVSIDKKKDSLS